MKNVVALDEGIIRDIGRAFADYDYGAERGLIDAFPNREAVAAFICGYVRMALQSGMLYAVGENGEGYIAYRLPGQNVRLRAMLPLAKGLLGSMKFTDLIRFARIMSQGGASLHQQFDRAKKMHIYVGLVCVREKYQGQGYMRKVLDLAFAEGNRLHLPVILDTDAKSKCDKYIHLGMQLAGTRRFGECGALYDLIKYPDFESANRRKQDAVFGKTEIIRGGASVRKCGHRRRAVPLYTVRERGRSDARIPKRRYEHA